MTCSLLFVPPYDADTRLVDLATGRHGYGHVAIWGGLSDADGPVVFDAGIGYGVGFRSLTIATSGRSFFERRLDEHLGRWVWNRAVACAGCEYDYAGLVRSRRSMGRYTCSGLVASCMPEHIRADLPGRCSPNDLARYFDVPPWRR
jgi:hypothetical protein